ncbi:ATP-binding protein [Allokutzneria sp. A3M-2-11 16]|uniref:ATP-binding protein n=1 Tax=Allokutzneria sp. A3M-2-11 16 TaxID=2962043 RepID=UPI0020B74FFE|nr:ATP-binding protein [Allokutzneria sp. A3M-2-11 16]MCP3803110.1 ATP-binding protein [Allokutzneria sp. A3M-2-11 16]
MCSQPLGALNISASITCDLDAMSMREVRDQVRGLLAGGTGVPVEDAVQVVDELVSNSHRHGAAPRNCRISLVGRDRLRVEVDDGSLDLPRIRPPDNSGGRGLLLVDRIASAWGATRREHAKTVWAEVDLGRPGVRGRAPHLARSS